MYWGVTPLLHVMHSIVKWTVVRTGLDLGVWVRRVIVVGGRGLVIVVLVGGLFLLVYYSK